MFHSSNAAALAVLLAAFSAPVAVRGQVFTLSREQLIRYTAQCTFERLPDGRPKTPDAILEKLRDMSSEEVLFWTRGYANQYVGDLRVLNPARKLIGRAVTIQLMPSRADMRDADAKEYKPKGQYWGRTLGVQAGTDILQPGDVLVVDAGGNVAGGGLIGDNLAYFIWKKTGAGFVIDGAIRDLEGIAPFDMAGYFRGAVPGSYNANLMVTGVNIPVRIGNATVLPGDVVFGDREGVTFIPPHLIEDMVNNARITRIHDEWTKKKFDEGAQHSSEIYGSPSDPALVKEYEDYLKQKLGDKAYEEYKKRPRIPPPAPR